MNEISIADIGGRKAAQIATEEHRPTVIERHIDAMMMLLLRPGGRTAWKTDELRRAIEELAPEFYQASAYYERWVTAMRDLLIEKGVTTTAEVEAKLAEVKSRTTGKG